MRVNKAIYFWLDFPLLYNTKPYNSTRSKLTLWEMGSLNMPADLPAPAFLGEDSCLYTLLAPLQLLPLLCCLSAHALWSDNRRDLLHKFLKSHPSTVPQISVFCINRRQCTETDIFK